MSVLDSEDGLSRAQYVRSAEDPAALLEAIVSGKNQDGAIGGLVGHLGRADYSTLDFLGDVTRVKEKIAAAGGPVDRLIDHWSLLDHAVSKCLALTSLSHEKFLDNTLHAFCEFDRAGVIVYANARM